MRHQVVQPPQRLPVERRGQRGSRRAQLGNRRRLGALRRLTAGIGAGAQHGQHAAARVDGQRPRAVRVLDHYRHAVVRVELADAVGLLLREQQAAVGGGHEAVGVVGALPRPHPGAAGGDDARDRRNGRPHARGAGPPPAPRWRRRAAAGGGDKRGEARSVENAGHARPNRSSSTRENDQRLTTDRGYSQGPCASFFQCSCCCSGSVGARCRRGPRRRRPAGEMPAPAPATAGRDPGGRSVPRGLRDAVQRHVERRPEGDSHQGGRLHRGRLSVREHQDLPGTRHHRHRHAAGRARHGGQHVVQRRPRTSSSPARRTAQARSLPFGGQHGEETHSAKWYLVPNFADELKRQVNGRPRVVSLSLKARSAIGLGGHGGVNSTIVWKEDGAATFATSSALTQDGFRSRGRLRAVASGLAEAIRDLGTGEAGSELQIRRSGARRAGHPRHVSAPFQRTRPAVRHHRVDPRLLGRHADGGRVPGRAGRAPDRAGEAGTATDHGLSRRQLLDTRHRGPRLRPAQPRGAGRAAAPGRDHRAPAGGARRQGGPRPLRAGLLVGPRRVHAAGADVSRSLPAAEARRWRLASPAASRRPTSPTPSKRRSTSSSAGGTTSRPWRHRTCTSCPACSSVSAPTRRRCRPSRQPSSACAASRNCTGRPMSPPPRRRPIRR